MASARIGKRKEGKVVSAMSNEDLIRTSRTGEKKFRSVAKKELAKRGVEDT